MIAHITVSLPHACALCASLLALLVRVTQLVVHCLDSVNLCCEFLLLRLVGYAVNQASARMRAEELVLPVVQRPLLSLLVRFKLCCGPGLEHLLQDIDVVGNAEEVPAVFVGEQVKDLRETRPGDAAEAEAARLVGGEENAVLGRVGPNGRVGVRLGEEAVDAVDFAVQQRRHGLVVGGHGERLERLLVEHCRAKELASAGNALAR